MGTVRLERNGKVAGTLTVADFYEIEVDGKTYTLDDCYPHPWPIGKDGEAIGHRCKSGEPRTWEGKPFWKHRFWTAAWWWAKQGKRVKDGKCVWEPVYDYKPVTEMRGRSRFVIGDGERFEVESWMPQAMSTGPFTRPHRPPPNQTSEPS